MTKIEDKDFLDEIFQEVENIEKERRSQPYEKVFAFPEHLFEVENKKFEVPQIVKDYCDFAMKFKRLGVLENVSLFTEKDRFSVELIPEKFIDFYKSKYPSISATTEIKKFGFWITKKEEDYFIKGKPVNIRNKNTQYFKIFESLFSLAPEGGIVEYPNISKIFYSKYGKKITKQQILRALTGASASLFKLVPEFASTGNNLFTATRDGKHISFNNKIS